MGLPVLRVNIMAVVGGHQRDMKLRGHAEKGLVHLALHGDPMVLQLQKIIAFAEDLQMLFRRRLRFLIKTFFQKPGDLSGQAGAQGDDPLVVGS